MEEASGAQIAAVALVLVVGQLLAPRVYRARRGLVAETASLAGGMAAAVVFLHLIPEIDAGHELLGRRVYFMILAGFTAFYGAEVAMAGVSGKREHSLAVHVLLAAFYSALVGFTLAEQLPAGVGSTLIFSVTLGLHFVTLGNGLQEQFEDSYLELRVPWILALSTLIGTVVSWLMTISERSVDIGTALLAGFMLFNVVRNEIPDTTKVRFWWFLSGLAVVVISVLIVDG